MNKWFFHIALVFLFVSCEEEKTPDTNIYEIRNVGELSTTEYTIGKIIKVDDSSSEAVWYNPTKYGDRKILISCKAKVKAGVDLSEIDDEDIVVKGNSIEITLPPVEITSFSMDPSLIETEMESVDGFRDAFTQEEKNDFLKQGEEAIKSELGSTGILEDARENAEAFLKEFYKQLGYESVTVKHSSD